MDNIQINLNEANSNNKKSIKIITDTLKEELDEIEKIDIKFLEERVLRNKVTKMYNNMQDCLEISEFKAYKNNTFILYSSKYQYLLFELQARSMEKDTKELERNLNIQIEKQKRFEKENSKTVYSMISFMMSFSLVSAGVTAIEKAKSIKEVAAMYLFLIVIMILTFCMIEYFRKK